VSGSYRNAVRSGAFIIHDITRVSSFQRLKHQRFDLVGCLCATPDASGHDADDRFAFAPFTAARARGIVAGRAKVGFSTHEYTDWESSILIAYAKGARTFERHIDIEADGIPVSPYCTLPQQADRWFKAFQRVKTMCGHPGSVKRTPTPDEIHYLDNLLRGVYAKRALEKGHILSMDDLYLAVPLQRGQASCREVMSGLRLIQNIEKDGAISIESLDTPFSIDEGLRKELLKRGL
jgi:hypothetical protein